MSMHCSIAIYSKCPQRWSACVFVACLYASVYMSICGHLGGCWIYAYLQEGSFRTCSSCKLSTHHGHDNQATAPCYVSILDMLQASALISHQHGLQGLHEEMVLMHCLQLPSKPCQLTLDCSYQSWDSGNSEKPSSRSTELFASLSCPFLANSFSCTAASCC